MAENDEKPRRPDPADRFCWGEDDIVITRANDKEPKPKPGKVY